MCKKCREAHRIYEAKMLEAEQAEMAAMKPAETAYWKVKHPLEDAMSKALEGPVKVLNKSRAKAEKTHDKAEMISKRDLYIELAKCKDGCFVDGGEVM